MKKFLLLILFAVLLVGCGPIKKNSGDLFEGQLHHEKHSDANAVYTCYEKIKLNNDKTNAKNDVTVEVDPNGKLIAFGKITNYSTEKYFNYWCNLGQTGIEKLKSSNETGIYYDQKCDKDINLVSNRQIYVVSELLTERAAYHMSSVSQYIKDGVFDVNKWRDFYINDFKYTCD